MVRRRLAQRFSIPVEEPMSPTRRGALRFCDAVPHRTLSQEHGGRRDDVILFGGQKGGANAPRSNGRTFEHYAAWWQVMHFIDSRKSKLWDTDFLFWRQKRANERREEEAKSHSRSSFLNEIE